MSVRPYDELFLGYMRPLLHRLYAVARQYVTQEADARDLVQETLLRAWRSFAPTDERTYHHAWMFAILRNIALDWQRAAARRIQLTLATDSELTELLASELTEPLAPFPAMSESEFREFLDERIVQALDATEAPHREVLILSVAGGLSYREIAQVLGCPIGTVMSRMARARRILRERLVDLARARDRARPRRP